MKDIVTTTEVRELLISLADFYEEKKEELSSYDAVIGDGDHGMTLARIRSRKRGDRKHCCRRCRYIF